MYLIEATVKSLTVEDLGLFIGVNLPKTVSEEDFKSSVCLAELIRKGLLRASRTNLCREEIRAKAAKKKKNVPQKIPTPEVGAPKRGAQNQGAIVREERPLSMGFIRREELSEVVSEAVRNTLVSLTGMTKTLSSVNAPQELEKPQNRALQSKPFSEDIPIGDAPVFIPSGLVPKGSSGEITVTSQSQSSESLGDSAAALKKLRKGSSK